MRYTQPHLVLFQNEDGTWGHHGELDRYLGITTDQGNQVGSSSQARPKRQWKAEAEFFKTQFNRNLQVIEDLRKMHGDAADKLYTGISAAYFGLGIADHHIVLPTVPSAVEHVVGFTGEGQMTPIARYSGVKTTAARHTPAQKNRGTKRGRFGDQ